MDSDNNPIPQFFMIQKKNRDQLELTFEIKLLLQNRKILGKEIGSTRIGDFPDQSLIIEENIS